MHPQYILRHVLGRTEKISVYRVIPPSAEAYRQAACEDILSKRAMELGTSFYLVFQAYYRVSRQNKDAKEACQIKKERWLRRQCAGSPRSSPDMGRMQQDLVASQQEVVRLPWGRCSVPEKE